MLGPGGPGVPPETITVAVRRYRCTACGAVPTVVPRETAARQRYSRPAILVALALWSLLELDGGEVRRRISPHPARGFAEPRVWPSLRRWVRDRHHLWPEVSVAARATHRETAGALVAALCARMARAPPVPTVADAWQAALAL